MDIINAHGGDACNHLAHAKQIVERLIKYERITESAYIVLGPQAKKKYNKLESAIAREEYLIYLFIAQVHDKRYGNLKKFFVNDGLKGNVTYDVSKNI